MRKIFVACILFFGIQGISYANIEVYKEELQKLDNNYEQLIEGIDSIKKNILLSKKETATYYKLLISQSEKEIEIIQNNISILQYILICNDEGGFCSSKIFDSNYSQEEFVIEEIQNKLSIMRGNLDLEEEKIVLYEKSIQDIQAQEDILLKEREQRAEEYFQSAEKKLAAWDIKSAIWSYVYSCSNKPSYECYYALSNAYFLQAQEYYKNISSYGYDRLFTEQKNNALESLNKSLGLSEMDAQKEVVNTLKSEIESYPNKEEKETIEAPAQYTTNTQVELIWSRIEKLTSSKSEIEKEAIYSILITKLQEYINKSQDASLKAVLMEIVERLKNAQTQEEVVAIYDRTEEFYKTTLQEKTYSCEISATSDILSTLKNKNFTEDELIEQIDKSKFGETAQYSNGIYIWWNPNAGYVGYIDTDAKGNIASQRNLTGYGVYEAPIAKLYNQYWLKTEIINNSHYTTSFWTEQHLKKLLQEFTKGNYVQLWGDICTTPEYDDWELALEDITQEDVNKGKNAKNECWSFGQDRKRVWYYKEGEKLIKHQGLIWEHNFYLLGYEWDIDNPVNIIVWDTSTGKHTYPVKEWMRKWEEMDFRSIIIYSK